jgi:gas vesicle protein
MNDHGMFGEPQGTGITSALTGFVVGAAVGAGLALLLAPRTGEGTRRKLGELADRISDTARDSVGRAKDAVGHLKHDAGQVVNAGVDAANQAKQEMESRLSK